MVIDNDDDEKEQYSANPLFGGQQHGNKNTQRPALTDLYDGIDEKIHKN